MADHLLTTVHQRRYFEMKYGSVPETRDELVREVQNEYDNVLETPDIIQSIEDSSQYRRALRHVKSYEGGSRKATKRRLSPKRIKAPERDTEGSEVDLGSIPELPPHLRPIHDRPQVNMIIL